MIILLLRIFSWKYQTIDKYGCRVTIESDIYWLYQFPVILIYIMWDIYLLLLYIFKIWQYQQIQKQKQRKNAEIFKQIGFILKKMVFLTVFIKIIASITFLAGFLPEATAGMLFYHTVACIYHISAVCIVYLMIEANNDKYILFINKFCCQIMQI